MAILLLWYDPAKSPGYFIIVLTFSFAGLFYTCGFLANSIWDMELEDSYENEKREISQAVRQVGQNRLRHYLIIGVVASLGLSILVAWQINSWVPIALYGVGLFFGIGYSAPPLRWKERGPLLHAVSLGISTFFLPFYLVSGMLRGGFNKELLILGIGIALLHYGLEIGNQLKDWEYDKKRNIHTLPFRSVRGSCITGIACVIGGLFWTLAVLASLLDMNPLVFGLTSFVELAIHFPILIYYWKTVRTFTTQNTTMQTTLRYSQWQTSSMIGLLLVAFIVKLSSFSHP